MIATPDLAIERTLWKAGWNLVAGMDEAGRGALAGPVAAGAVILPPAHPCLDRTLAGVRDSKQMTPLQREKLAPRIRETALAWAVAYATAEEIDMLGIAAATRLAATRALHSLPTMPDYLLTDYLLVPDTEIPQTTLVRGDQKVLSIAAASVLAKTSRDALMCKLDVAYPGYGLARHKGYGTWQHREALARLKPSAIHRKSFRLY
jgi:ribonuclease HII